MTPRDCQQALSTLFRGTLPLSCGLIYLSGTIDISLTVPLRTQRQLNTEFDPLLSLVNRKFCGGGGWKGSDYPCSLSLAAPPLRYLSLFTWNTPRFTLQSWWDTSSLCLCVRGTGIFPWTLRMPSKRDLYISECGCLGQGGQINCASGSFRSPIEKLSIYTWTDEY